MATFLSAFSQVMINLMNSTKFLDLFNGQLKSLDFDLLMENLREKMDSTRSVLDDSSEPASEEWLDKLKDAVFGADDLLEEVAYEALRCTMEEEPHQQASKFQKSVTEKFKTLLKKLAFIPGKDEDISQSLESSHQMLCSEYCAILPTGYKFRKEDLILLWIGAGFVTDTSQGEKCFQKLLSESLFRESSECLYSVTNHHSRSVPGEFFFNLETKVSHRDAKRIRHVSVTEDAAFRQLKLIYEAQSLRTFFAVKPSNSQASKRMNDGVVERLMQKFKRLKVLSFPGYDNVAELSNSIGHLKYLRYLNVSRTEIKRLPEYVCSLYFLEILILYGCKELNELPSNLGRLINLFHIDNRGTRLQGMPPHLGALTKLQTLTDFFVRKENSRSITDLGMLQHLQGELCVRNLQYVTDAEDAREAHLDGKNMLTKLELRWDADTDSSDKVLELLQPHMNLEHLAVTGYGGTIFPSWLGDSRFGKMVLLNLHGCKKCSSLPSVGQLPCLQELSIAEFHGVKNVGLELFGSSTAAVQKKPFLSLKILRFERMQNWEKWDSDAIIGAFRLLEELHIIDCPKLKGTLPGFLPSLTTLETRGCELGFDNLLPNAPSVFKMGLKDGSGLLELQHLSSGMCYLKIDRISSLDFLLETMKKASGLCATIEVIHISRCNSVKSFYLEDFPNLTKFHINSCPLLESLYEHEAVPENSSSTEIVEEHLQSKQKFPLIQELYVKDCPKLSKVLPSNLPSLQVIHVSGCHSLKFFQFKLVPNLERVDISECSNLESLFNPSSGDSSNFPRLEKLYIRQCPKLIKVLPSHLPCLTILEAEGCQQIMGSSLPDIPAIRRIKFRADTCHVELDRSQVEIRNWDSLLCFPMDIFHVHELNEVAIISCENLEYLSRSKALGDFNFLTRMKIWGCPKLVSFPGEFSAPKLTLLSLRKCTALKSLPEEMQSLFPSLQDLQLIDCPSLEILSEKSFPSELKSLKIQGCKKLSGGSKLKDFLAGSHLSSFVFDMSEDAESFPGDIKCPSTIKHLEIEGCLKVKSLDKELDDLTSMETLIIGSCPLLKSIEGLPSSLSKLSISNCPSLEDWFLQKENRSKFPQVKCIKINYRNLNTWVFPSKSEEPKLPSPSSKSVSPSDSAINLQIQNGSSSSALLPSQF